MTEEIRVDATGTPEAAKRRGGPAAEPESDDILALFRADMAEELAEADIKVPHKYRRGYEMTFGTDLNARTLLQWQKRCIIQGSRTKEVDAMKLSSILLANLNTSVTREGVALTDPTSGENVTFRDPIFWSAFGASDSVEAVQLFFARDGFLQATAEAVLKACGYDDEVTPDPIDG